MRHIEFRPSVVTVHPTPRDGGSRPMMLLGQLSPYPQSIGVVVPSVLAYVVQQHQLQYAQAT